MRILTYASFEKALFKYCKAELTKRKTWGIQDAFTKELLRAGIDGKDTLLDTVENSISSRYRTGKKPIKKEIVEEFYTEGARERVIKHLSFKILPLLPKTRIPNLIKELCGMIEKDTTISVSTKSELYQEATRDHLAEFLADLLIYAVAIDPLEKADDYPLFVGNLPLKNEFFIERKEIMDELHTNLQALPRILLLHGAGGMEKLS